MYKSVLLLFFPFAWISAGLPAQQTYTLTNAYKVFILGTSNLRDWKDSVGVVTGEMLASLNSDGSVDLCSIHIKMKTSSIKSNVGTALDKKTYKALKSDANPEIIFLLDVRVRIMQVRRGETPLFLKGYLTLAGVCRPVIMQVDLLKLENGQLQLEGSESLSMTDYGVKPPTVLFGTVRAHPKITIFFKTNFTNKQNEL